MNNKSNVGYAVTTIFSLLLVQFVVFYFLAAAWINFAIGDLANPYELWQLIGKIIVLTITIIFYYLYKKADMSNSRKAKYKLYLIGFTIFSVEIGVFYGYLYLIGI